MSEDSRRCPWATTELGIAYHDAEWGAPVHDDRTHFEFLVLEGAQAGLSWETILKKRDGYRRAFAEFDAQKVARFTERDVDRLAADASIVRHRGKIESAIGNARALLEVQAERGSFDAFIWDFVEGTPVQNRRQHSGEVPAETDVSRRMSRELKKRGFRFVGPTICYAYMQAAGLVNDHLVSCPRREACARMQ